ncbi:MAG TPA: ATP-binding protein [Myxococcales bacterium]
MAEDILAANKISSTPADHAQRLGRQVELLEADNAVQARALERATSDLLASEQRYRTLMENAHDAITILSPDGTIIEVNQRAVELMGRPREEQVGHRLSDWFVPELRDEHIASFKRSIEPGAQTQHDVPMPRADGTTMYLDFNNRIVQLGDGPVVMSIGRDVSDRHRGAEELQLLHLVALEANEAEDLNAALQLVLAKICEATGWAGGVAWMPNAAGTAIEPRCLWARHQSVLERFSSVVPRSLARGQGLAGLAWQTAEPIWSEDMANDPRSALDPQLGIRCAATIPVVLQDEVVAVLQCAGGAVRAEEPRSLKLAAAIAAHAGSAIRRKRTEEALKRSEEQFRQAQKMEAIGRLSGGIAHDFNNLLGVIIANAEMLKEQLPEGDPRREDAEQIKIAGDRAAKLTRQLLAFSRKQVLEPRVVSMSAVIGGMEEMLRRLLGADIRFVTDVAVDAGQVFADAGQLEQVMMNLAVNARDAMPLGGDLRIEASNVVLDEGYALEHTPVKPGPYVRVSVSDSGHGMDEETRRRAFEPFFTTKEKSRGSGLGLSTCYGIVKQSEGYIWLYSEPGKGTTFKIYLPRVDLPTDAAPAPVLELVRGGSETILVVEDEESLRRVVRRSLAERGYQVLIARDAAEGLAICTASGSCIDLIVSDVITPSLSGPEMGQRLRDAGNMTPILFMSGYVDSMLPVGGILQPGVNFIQKPFAPDALARKVREMLDAAISQKAR